VKLQRAFSNFHFFGTATLAVMLVPSFRFVRLSLRFDWPLYLEFFWGFNLVSACGLAYLFQALESPKTAFNWILKPSASQKFPSKALFSITVVSIYFFIGFVLVLCYNDVIAALRFDGSQDLALNQTDSYLLFGTTVTAVAHWILKSGPHGVRLIAAFIYLVTSPVVSAGIIFLTFHEGRSVAIRLAGCMLTAYYLSLIIFYLLPTTGPYYLCPIHPTGMTPVLNLFRSHGRPQIIKLDYFIGFPSMHVGAPAILLWYMRRYSRSAIFLASLLALLVPSIIILEEHYILDIIGGWCVALVAIAFVEWPSLSRDVSASEVLVAKPPVKG
jgi:PAP2 superfamily